MVASHLLEQLKMRYPVIQAPMAGVSTPAMAAAVSNAGALGSIGIGAESAEGAEKMIRATMTLTDLPFNVNVFCHRPVPADPIRERKWIDQIAPQFRAFDAQPPAELREIYQSFLVNDGVMDVLSKLRPAVVSFHFGLPSAAQINSLRERDIFLIASATNLQEARQAQQAGMDAVVAQGFEAGGHRGTFEPDSSDDCLGVLVLTRMLVNDIDIPVIAAGGIMDGASISSVLKMGAAAAQLGTAFILCPESSADEGYRRALQSDAAYHTIMTRAISGRPARCLANRFTVLGASCEDQDIPHYPRAYDLAKALHAAAKAAGEFGYGAQWAGQGAPLARSMPAADLIDTLVREMD